MCKKARVPLYISAASFDNRGMTQKIQMLKDFTGPIVLVGLMGAGKSTIGRRLASELNWGFVDSDDEIIEAAGCNIADIFESYGEEMFRDLEYRVMTRLMDREKTVIATGGGAWIQDNVRLLIKRKALSVWLDANLETLLERVAHRSHRPLLEAGDKKEILEKLMGERYPLYAKADLTVDSGLGNHEEVVQVMIERMAEFVK